MIPVALLVLIFIALVGFATARKSELNLARVYTFGLIYFIVAINLLSNIFTVSVPIATRIIVVASILVIIIRTVIDRGYLALLFPRICIQLTTFLILYIAISNFIYWLNFDYAAQNFDAYYAIQDATFLSSNPTSTIAKMTAMRDASELLPLNWSSSTIDRYGPSFLLASLGAFKITNLWSQAQYLGVGILMIHVLVFYQIANLLRSKIQRRSLVFLAIFGGVFSPFFIMQWQYFMFGQMVAIPGFLLLIMKLSEFRFTKLDYLQIVLINSFLFISYPAIFFVSTAFTFIALGVKSFSLGSSIKSIFFSSFYAIIAFVSFMTLSFAGSLENPAKRFMVWFSTNTDKDSDVSWQTLQLFSQFTSKFALPLWLGIIPYPFSGMLTNLQLSLLNMIALLIFTFIIKNLAHSARDNQFAGTFVFLLIFLFLFVFAAFVLAEAYLIVKVLVWLMPVMTVIFLIFFFGAITEVKRMPKSGAKMSGVVKLTIISICIIMSVSTSSLYVSRSLVWSNFPQIIKPDEYFAPANLFQNVNGRFAILTPTTEEAIWFTGQLPNSLQTKAYSLGSSGQSLGLSMSDVCALSKAQRDFGEIRHMVHNPRIVDSISSLNFRGGPSKDLAEWRIYDSKQLVSGIIIQGDGLTAPWLKESTSPPLLGSSVIRWSSNQVCFGVFSERERIVNLEIPFLSGPDLIKMKTWIADSAIVNISFEESSKEGKVKITYNAPLGWSVLSLRQPGCLDSLLKNRWVPRADDRKLCFAIGTINADWK